jgi:NAD(P)-dependent dehydrogenase (short-subunit alcohol dehydrogenase family)
MSNELLTDKTAAIYGAGGSIGGAVARTFAREGATVHLAGRTLPPLQAVADDIRATGGTAHNGTRTAFLTARAAARNMDGVAETLTREKLSAVNPGMDVDPQQIVAMIARRTMLGRAPAVQQVADAAAFLASDRAGASTSQMVNATCGLVAG